MPSNHLPTKPQLLKVCHLPPILYKLSRAPTGIKPTRSVTPHTATAAIASSGATQQDVLLHNGFGSWLKSFGHPATHNSTGSSLEVGTTDTSTRAENLLESHEQVTAVQGARNAATKYFQGLIKPPKVRLPVRSGETGAYYCYWKEQNIKWRKIAISQSDRWSLVSSWRTHRCVARAR